MKIAVISAHFHPEPAAGQRVHELCEAFAAAGFEVVAFTATPRADGEPVRAGGDGLLRVRHLWRPVSPGTGLLRKALAMAIFHGAAAAGVLASREKFDVIVSISTPPLSHVTGVCLAALRRCKHVFWCADVHPEATIRLGLMNRNGIATRALSYLNRWAMRRCDAIVAVGSCMREFLISLGAPPARTFVLPMWQRDEVSVQHHNGDVAALRSQLALTGRFVAMYSGNLGRMHDFGAVLEAAQRLSEEVTFLFAGEGPALRGVMDFQQRAGASNIQLRPLFPEDQLSVSLSIPDVHLITLRGEMSGLSVPGKLYGAMASGRPVIFIGPEESEVALTIRREDCGFVVAPGDTDRLVYALRQLKSNSELANQLGERGRQAFHERYCMSKRTSEWVRMVDGIVHAGLVGEHG